MKDIVQIYDIRYGTDEWTLLTVQSTPDA